jgi:hypothetical protein
MGKAPAFQFYVKDFLSDPQLQMCCSATRGVWINALCFMWESNERGVLSGPWPGLAKLLNATQDEFITFLNEANATGFCTVNASSPDGSPVTFPLHVTQCNILVTLTNRRMYREEKERQNTRLRVRKHRSNKSSNESVTVPSSSSSPYNSKELHRNCPEVEIDSGPVIISIPLLDKSEFEIRQSDVDEWKEAYPAVDVVQELNKIRQWNKSNPKNRKRPAGIRRHITGWLGKAQDRAPRVQDQTKDDPFELGFRAAEQGYLPNPPSDVDQKKWLEGYKWYQHKAESNK